VRARVVRTLPRLTLAAALLLGTAPARGALDRCMTPFEEEVHLLVNQRRAQGAVYGGTAYAQASKPSRCCTTPPNATARTWRSVTSSTI
jgi:hypothetical protein